MASTSAKKSVPMKSVPGKTVPGKTVHGKSLPGKLVHGKSLPGKSVPGKTVPGKSLLLSSANHSPKKNSNGSNGNLNNNKSAIPSNGLVPLENESLESYITLPSCMHLSKVLQGNSRDAVLKSYSAALNVVIFGILTNNNIIKENQFVNKSGQKINLKLLKISRSKILKCKDCHESFNKGEIIDIHNNLYMCLQCINICCWSKGHAYNHMKNSGHVFGINPDNAEIMCLKCGDLVFHPLLERIRYTAFKNAKLLKNYPGLSYFDTEHKTKNFELINKSTRLPSFKESLGLRGFINLGSTCFMSSVLQTVIHNPFIKRYYLNDSHSDCKKPKNECMSCCLNEIYQDFFTNPSMTGFGLTSFIESAWKVKRSLAGYSEQDAHEFWQFLIHQIHKNDTKSSRYIKNKESTPIIESLSSTPLSSSSSNLSIHNNLECDCIIHKTFSGTLESTLTCTVCGETRTIQDPMLDISLEIQDKQNGEKVSLKDLHSCLRKYTRIEELDVLYECNSCKKKTKVTKRLRLNKLPPVLSIQLKRFEHIGVSSKIDYHIDIPTILDIKDYIPENDGKNLQKITKYELFGIVCHLGNVNTGHYLAYVKNNNGTWFKFDDAKITRISESEVKKVNGYMLVYCITGDI